jgi:hypothetical protein
LSTLLKNSLFLTISAILLFPAIVGAQTEITSISQNAETIGLYEKFELTFTLSRSYDNPFDPNVVDITVIFSKPDGNTVTIPAFFYKEYDYTNGRYTNGRNPCWKARFAPSQIGEHTISQIIIVDENGRATINPHVSFICIESSEKGFIRTDPCDSYYMRYANGCPYLPIGHNVGWLPAGPDDWEHYFTSMGAVSENWTRIWMTHFY